MSNGTSPRASSSTAQLSPSPSWAPPRYPLTPNRLAKLANALGVSTPLPYAHNHNHNHQQQQQQPLSRSPTPSGSASSYTRSPSPFPSPYLQSTSKYLLHVVPPLHIPHDHNPAFTPPPQNASGYHSHFRRGTLVPMHSTLQAQLGAIAKEYALPSTTGLVLYLVPTTTKSPATSPSPYRSIHDDNDNDDDDQEPGPRLSDDIWKHLWSRVAQSERSEATTAASRSDSPANSMLGLGLVYRSRPQPQPASSISSSDPGTPSADNETPSTTPQTSISESEQHELLAFRANSLDLPGLNGSPINTFVPILAKVQFEIDRNRAGWYEPWLRSRRLNHAKRAGTGTTSRQGTTTTHTTGSIAEEGEEGKSALLGLQLVSRIQTESPLSFLVAGPPPPAQLPFEPSESSSSSSSEEEEGEDEEESEYEQIQDQDDVKQQQDPLQDVFGTDQDTWADIHDDDDDEKDENDTTKPQQQQQRQQLNPNIIPLALTASDLSSSTDDSFDSQATETDEVALLLAQISRPHLSVTTPSSPPTMNNADGSPPRKKQVPPPLVLTSSSLNVNANNNGGGGSGNGNGLVPVLLGDGGLGSAASSSGSGLPYLKERGGESGESSGVERLEEHDHENREREDEDGPDNGEEDEQGEREYGQERKRGGGVFEDFDIGLEFGDDTFDEDDPNDRRKSQYEMKAKLDEIERSLAQFSPRMLETDLKDIPEEQPYGDRLSPSVTRNGDVYPPSPSFSKALSSGSSSTPTPSWPSVPFSSINNNDSATNDPAHASSSSSSPPPPTFAFNGVTTAAPKAFHQARTASYSSQHNSESELRKRDLHEDMLYPALAPALSRSGSANGVGGDSPVIPLSPDPFGRYPSVQESASSSRQSAAYWDSENQHKQRPSISTTLSSRFSADSMNGSEVVAAATGSGASGTSGGMKNAASGLMTVNTIKKLWRKSNKSSVSSTASHEPPPPNVPSRRPSSSMDRNPSLEIPSNSRGPSPSPALSPTTAQHQSSSSQQQQRAGMMTQFHFDGESAYPSVRRSPSVPPATLGGPSPQLPPIPLATVQEQQSERGSSGMGSVRKSILKSFKSASNGMTRSSSASATMGASEQDINHATKAASSSSSSIPSSGSSSRGGKRPSLLMNLGGGHNSRASSSSVAALELPPSPMLPEHFQTRTSGGNTPDPRQFPHRSSRLGTGAPPALPTNGRAVPNHHNGGAGGDYFRSSSSFEASTSPPRSTLSSRSGGDDSNDAERPSFDSSQFEMISPVKGGGGGYPYHGLNDD